MTDTLAQVAIIAVLLGGLLVLRKSKWWFVRWLRRHPRSGDAE